MAMEAQGDLPVAVLLLRILQTKDNVNLLRQLIMNIKDMEIPDHYWSTLMNNVLILWQTNTSPIIKRTILKLGKDLMPRGYQICKSEFENLAYKGAYWCKNAVVQESETKASGATLQMFGQTPTSPHTRTIQQDQLAETSNPDSVTEKDKDLFIHYMCNLLDRMKPKEYEEGDNVEVLKGKNFVPATYIGKAGTQGECRVRYDSIYCPPVKTEAVDPAQEEERHLQIETVKEAYVVDRKNGSRVNSFKVDREVDFKYDNGTWFHGKMRKIKANGNYMIEISSQGNMLQECPKASSESLIRLHQPFEMRKRKIWHLDA